jgi:chaperonin GroEL (HSP60 family)
MPKCVFEDRQGLSQKVLDGVNKLADNVAATLGPKGRNRLFIWTMSLKTLPHRF